MLSVVANPDILPKSHLFKFISPLSTDYSYLIAFVRFLLLLIFELRIYVEVYISELGGEHHFPTELLPRCPFSDSCRIPTTLPPLLILVFRIVHYSQLGFLSA